MVANIYFKWRIICITILSTNNDRQIGGNHIRIDVITTDKPLLSVATGAAYFGITGTVPSYNDCPNYSC